MPSTKLVRTNIQSLEDKIVFDTKQSLPSGSKIMA